MPSQTTCPSCGGPLRVPDELYGKRVQCPTCQVIFVADDPSPRRHDERPARRFRPADEYEVVEDYDEPAPRRRRRWVEPHRGSTVLTLGILSLVVCSPLGIAAWVMGNTDLAAMRRGDMDPSGEGTTQAGRICGMIGTARLAVECMIGVLYAFLMAAVGVHGRL
ncbi:MAG TPA: hypothetical protein VGF55_03255 [Gemmataceae bacterium]|jgi:hypothetical protein